MVLLDVSSLEFASISCEDLTLKFEGRVMKTSLPNSFDKVNCLIWIHTLKCALDYFGLETCKEPLIKDSGNSLANVLSRTTAEEHRNYTVVTKHRYTFELYIDKCPMKFELSSDLDEVCVSWINRYGVGIEYLPTILAILEFFVVQLVS
jgi:hypothetical protein